MCEMPPCDGETDRWTDIMTVTSTALSTAGHAATL